MREVTGNSQWIISQIGQPRPLIAPKLDEALQQALHMKWCVKCTLLPRAEFVFKSSKLASFRSSAAGGGKRMKEAKK